MLYEVITVVKVDVFNNEWIGTNSGGLVKFDGTTWTVYNTTNSGIPDNRVNTIYTEANGHIWVGTANGLAYFDGEIWTVYNTGNSGLPSNSIRAIGKDLFGVYWLGTFNGLVKYNGTDWTVYNTDNSGLPGNVINDIAIESSFRNNFV